MKTNAWYNWHFWLWDLRSWLCHYKIRRCPDCRKNDLVNAIENGEVAHECDTSNWFGAPGDTRFCDVCAAYWRAEKWGELDIKWVMVA